MFTYPSITIYNALTSVYFLMAVNCMWYIQEKVDGSNLTIEIDDNGQICFANKGKKIASEKPNPCFLNAVQQMKKKEKVLNPNYVYCGESVCKPKHNIIPYMRTPRHFFICFDIYDKTNECYLNPTELNKECTRIDIEQAPVLYSNTDQTVDPSTVIEDLMKKIASDMKFI